MNSDPVTVRRLLPEEVFPAVQMVKAARIGFSLSVMLISLGALQMRADLSSGDSDMNSGSVPVQNTSREPLPSAVRDFWLSAGKMSASHVVIRTVPVIVSETWREAIQMISEGVMGRPRRLITTFRNLILIAFAAIAVGVICGIDVCRDERCGVLSALRTAIKRLPSGMMTTVLAVLLVWLPWGLLFGTGRVLHGIGVLSLFPTACSVTVWLMAFGCCLWSVIVPVSWLLSLSAIAVDGCSGTDALSRGISYCLSHRLRVSFYAALIFLIMLVFGEAVQIFADAASNIADGLVISGSGESRQAEPGVGSCDNGGPLIHAASYVVAAYRLGVLLCGVTVSYVLLRNREDGTSVREMMSLSG